MLDEHLGREGDGEGGVFGDVEALGVCVDNFLDAGDFGLESELNFKLVVKSIRWKIVGQALMRLGGVQEEVAECGIDCAVEHALRRE